MPPSVDASNFVPGNNMAYAYGDVQIAMRADPRFVTLGISPGGSLHRIGDSSLYFGALYP
jgi:hypothetical protein